MHQRYPLFKVDEEIEPLVLTQSLEQPLSSTNMDTADPGEQVSTFENSYTDEYMTDMVEDKFAQVARYLAKPFRITTVSFAATNAISDTLWSMTDTWAIPSLVPAWLDKLRGFQGLKATLCLKVVVTANAFSAGKLRLMYYPAGDDNLRKTTIHTVHRISYSQLPGVDINLQDPIGVLKIPYKTPFQYYNMTENAPSWGSVYLKVLAPYRTGPDNQTSVQCVVWAWLEDVTLYGQTHPGIVTQSLDQPLKPTDSNKESKPISGFFANSSKALVSLSGIPILRSYLATPIWALNALSGIACSLGYSKPYKAMIVGRNAIGSLFNMANSDGERAGNPLSLLSDASLAPICDLSRDGEDEASINYIKTRECYFDSFTITTATAVGANLYSRFPSPLESTFQVSPTENYYSPIGYLGRLFKLWRGSITYRYEFIKTPLHKGEVIICFQAGPSVAPTIDTSTYLYREVVDLAEVDSIEFTVPWVNAWEFLDSNIPSGRLDVLLVNPLQAPETVATTIDVLVYVKGHESLQFAVPGVPYNMSPYVTQSLDAPQSKLRHKNVGFIGNANGNSMGIGYNVRCNSEIVTSLLQIAKRHAVFDNFVLTPLLNFWKLNPYTLPCTRVGSQNGFSFVLSTLAAPFAFIRGGIETNITTNLVGAFSQVVRYQNDTSTYMTYLASPGTDNNAVTIANNINGGVLVETPYYGKSRAVPVRYTSDPLAEAPNFDIPKGSIVFDFNTTTSVISRAVADDFQFLFFVGIPRMAGSF